MLLFHLILIHSINAALLPYKWTETYTISLLFSCNKCWGWTVCLRLTMYCPTISKPHLIDSIELFLLNSKTNSCLIQNIQTNFGLNFEISSHLYFNSTLLKFSLHKRVKVLFLIPFVVNQLFISIFKNKWIN